MEMTNLTLENFWNEVRSKHPHAFAHFSTWIDEYKQEVGWDKLFCADVKFHHLPFEMQNGVLSRYDLQMFNNHDGTGKLRAIELQEAYKPNLMKLFADVEVSIKRRGSKLN